MVDTTPISRRRDRGRENAQKFSSGLRPIFNTSRVEPLSHYCVRELRLSNDILEKHRRKFLENIGWLRAIQMKNIPRERVLIRDPYIMGGCHAQMTGALNGFSSTIQIQHDINTIQWRASNLGNEIAMTLVLIKRESGSTALMAMELKQSEARATDQDEFLIGFGCSARARIV
ncbi:predicted protein [Histoplasma capsulatum G186AR]|uniref:Uncharacterized protein n=1 Tax=Ajellomyces capsulatus (strain G186AR / H82 / ATCC MYA-2454 / RMSCC 2432) TaxID=447093 RepID=C0NBE2_AJECG|nr:uncharacterized protein HCBG_00438 [Histoplasma capsulatum G186AR]EEH10983.1 predicted protein [Histoplasma capsulatum G186AR]